MKITKSIPLFIIVTLLAITSCGTVKESNGNKNTANYTISFVPNDEHIEEGNLRIDIYNDTDKLLVGAIVQVFSGDKKIKELNLGSSPAGVFTVEQKNIRVKVIKEGYEIIETEKIEMRPDYGCFIEFRLTKK